MSIGFFSLTHSIKQFSLFYAVFICQTYELNSLAAAAAAVNEFKFFPLSPCENEYSIRWSTCENIVRRQFCLFVPSKTYMNMLSMMSAYIIAFDIPSLMLYLFLLESRSRRKFASSFVSMPTHRHVHNVFKIGFDSIDVVIVINWKTIKWISWGRSFYTFGSF